MNRRVPLIFAAVTLLGCEGDKVTNPTSYAGSVVVEGSVEAQADGPVDGAMVTAGAYEDAACTVHLERVSGSLATDSLGAFSGEFFIESPSPVDFVVPCLELVITPPAQFESVQVRFADVRFKEPPVDTLILQVRVDSAG